MLAALPLSLLLAVPPSAAAPEVAPRDAAPIEKAGLRAEIAAYDRQAVEPLPALDDGQLDRLLRGEALGLYRPACDGRHAGTAGLLISTLDRDLLWAALRDPHLASADHVREQRLGHRRHADSELWHQVLNLPWPLGPRFWLVEVRNNLALARATGNRGWERSWDLVADAEARARQAVQSGQARTLAAEQLDAAVYTPVNHGAWTLLRLSDGRTLLGFQVTTVVGGVIPDELVARYSVGRMVEILRALEAKVDQLDGHLGPDHAPLLGGDGAPLVLPYAHTCLARGQDAGRGAL